MAVEGGLALRAVWDGRAVQRVEIRSGRPLEASRLLLGMTPQQAVDTVPMLFSLCGRAQTVAALLATEAARGETPGEPALHARKLLVGAEIAQEYLWRLLVDWPELLGQQAQWPLLAEARRRLGEVSARLLAGGEWKRADGSPPSAAEPGVRGGYLEALLERHVLGIAPPAWAEIADRAGLARWAGGADAAAARCCARLLDGEGDFGRSPVGFTPLADEEWLMMIAVEMGKTPGYPARPAWRGRPLETGALARTLRVPLVADLHARSGNSVLTRFAARVVELVSLVAGRERSAGRLGALAPAPGCGLGWVETARGLLLHRVEIEGGRVLRYAVLAPTEWNFHPDGALARGARGIRAGDPGEVRRRLSFLVQALDPCVSWEMEVCRA